MKLLLSVLLLYQCVAVWSFCGDRRQNVGIFRAAVKGLEWLKLQQKADGSWGDLHTTGQALLTLRLGGMEPHNKTAALQYISSSLRCDNNEPHKKQPLGQLSYAIHGIQALCHDPRDFVNHDWVQIVSKEMRKFPTLDFDDYFQYSLAVLVLCNMGVDVPRDVISQLIKEGQNKDGSYPLGEDVAAMSIMALKCVQNVESEVIARRRSKIYDAMQRAARYLLKQRDDTSHLKSGNQHTLSLFVQAMLAADRPTQSWECGKIMDMILSYQERDGSFGSLLGNTQVIPALIGALPSDLKSLPCEVSGSDKEEESETIKTCMKVVIEKDNGMSPDRVDMEVPKGTTALQGLDKAAQINRCYAYETLKTTFGRMITSICGLSQDPDEKYYWMLYDGDEAASVGADQLQLSAGKCAVFKFKKLDF